MQILAGSARCLGTVNCDSSLKMVVVDFGIEKLTSVENMGDTFHHGSSYYALSLMWPLTILKILPDPQQIAIQNWETIFYFNVKSSLILPS